MEEWGGVLQIFEISEGKARLGWKISNLVQVPVKKRGGGLADKTFSSPFLTLQKAVDLNLIVTSTEDKRKKRQIKS